jgi:hypothetical protein
MKDIYTLDEIWKAFCDRMNPDHKYTEDLIWHIENDECSWDAMHMAADLRCKESMPAIAKNLGKSDKGIREGAAGTLCRLLADGHPDIDAYANELYHVAKYDDDISNRALVANFMESIIEVVGDCMKIKIASLLLEYAQLLLSIKFVYIAMLRCLGESNHSLDAPRMYPDFVDEAKVQEFRKKYNV